MKGNHEETMSLKALAHKVLAGNQAGNHKETALRKKETFEETFCRKFPKKFPNSVTRIGQKCRECQYFDIGPTPDGKGTIRWCGPWRWADGSEHWFNIEEWGVCPLDIKQQTKVNGNIKQDVL